LFAVVVDRRIDGECLDELKHVYLSRKRISHCNN
jgi:hypothetical protein